MVSTFAYHLNIPPTYHIRAFICFVRDVTLQYSAFGGYIENRHGFICLSNFDEFKMIVEIPDWLEVKVV